VQVWGEAAVEPDLAAKVVPIHRRLESHLAQLLRTDAGPGSAERDCDAVAQVALAAVIGMAALVAAGVPVDERRFVDVLTELVDVPSEASPDSDDH
jgi:hypothetical protein